MSAAEAETGSRGVSLRSAAWRRFRRNRAALSSLFLLLFFVFVAIISPWLAPHEYHHQNLALGASSPSVAHWFGTDYEGRDLLSRTLVGARISFLVGFAATLVALGIGVTWGAIAGWYGGRVDSLMMRVVDVLYGLPYMFFVIILMVWFGRSFLNIFIGLGAVSWLTMARIVRGVVMSLKEKEYVLAARATGVPSRRILLRHVLPNALGPILVYATLTVPRVMMEEAFLSFLGLGVQPPLASWGSLIAEGASLFREYPWLLAFPAAVLSLTLLALNFLGDGLRDALDPKTEANS
ncbi:MAG: ABC transporter permease [Planctomycetota bacterium]